MRREAIFPVFAAVFITFSFQSFYFSSIICRVVSVMSYISGTEVL